MSKSCLYKPGLIDFINNNIMAQKSTTPFLRHNVVYRVVFWISITPWCHQREKHITPWYYRQN